MMIILAAVIVLLSGWNLYLTDKAWKSESIRRSDAKSAAAREELGCRVFTAIVDTAVDLPLQNLEEILEGDDLTDSERAKRMMARKRYQAAREALAPALAGCQPPGPPGVRGPIGVQPR